MVSGTVCVTQAGSGLASRSALTSTAAAAHSRESERHVEPARRAAPNAVLPRLPPLRRPPPPQVIRGGKEQLVTNHDVVVGDLMVLDTGDKIIADGYVVQARCAMLRCDAPCRAMPRCAAAISPRTFFLLRRALHACAGRYFSTLV